jgi:hypothetical protein
LLNEKWTGLMNRKKWKPGICERHKWIFIMKVVVNMVVNGRLELSGAMAS